MIIINTYQHMLDQRLGTCKSIARLILTTFTPTGRTQNDFAIKAQCVLLNKDYEIGEKCKG